jgi:trans-aconitate 2-methyltransferase
MAGETRDWDPGSYHRFRGLRLQPALDLLARVGLLPDGPIVDLGCGSGAMGPALRNRFANRDLVGLDLSASMLEEAEKTGCYDALIHADLTDWDTSIQPAILFSNAVLHWVADQPTIFARLVEMLAPGGTLAVQMPRQLHRPSHRLIYDVASDCFPDRFDGPPLAQVAPPAERHSWLSRLGEVDQWETEYYQVLPAAMDGHPVRLFTQSTACRPVFAKLNEAEVLRFQKAYDERLSSVCPLQSDGTVLFPFLRSFVVVSRA